MTDITDTLKADSTQLNAVDFGGQSRTYTVTSVRVVGGDQPVNIRLAEDVDGREYRPSKSMRRVLAACWGPDSDAWIGRRFTLYNDPSVRWGGKEVGGIKISHASHIDGPKKVMLQESSTVKRPHTVEPLIEVTPTPSKVDPSNAIEWFGTQNVTVANLEAHLSKPVAEWDANDMATLDRDRAELVGGQS